MNMIITDNWPEARMIRLESLYKAGLSFSLIALDIGGTRSAVIGKARRMQLPKRGEVIAARPRAATTRGKQARRRTTFRTTVVMIEPPPPAFIVEPGRDYRCSIYELTNKTCRLPLWNIGTPHEERLYCGVPDADVSNGRPYCRAHTASCVGSRLA